MIGSTQKELNRTFKTVEKIYNINEWKVGPNANNSKLKEGCEKLGINFSSLKEMSKLAQILVIAAWDVPSMRRRARS